MDDSSALSVEREKSSVKRRVLLTIMLGVWLRNANLGHSPLDGFLPKNG